MKPICTLVSVRSFFYGISTKIKRNVTHWNVYTRKDNAKKVSELREDKINFND